MSNYDIELNFNEITEDKIIKINVENSDVGPFIQKTIKILALYISNMLQPVKIDIYFNGE